MSSHPRGIFPLQAAELTITATLYTLLGTVPNGENSLRSRICSKGDERIMKKLILATLFLAVSSAVAFAAEFNGKWTADIPSRQGGTMTTTFTFKVDGAKLTGPMSSQMGDVDITNGKVDGDTIRFDVVRTFGDNTITLTYTGKADGADSIKFTRTMSGMPGGDGQIGRASSRAAG